MGVRFCPYREFANSLSSVVYTKSVPIIRDRKWRFYDKPVCIDIIAAGGIDLRHLQLWRDGERAKYMKKAYVPFQVHSPSVGDQYLHNVQSEVNPLFVQHTKRKIRVILASATILGYLDVALGALGCGAFENPTSLVAQCFKEVRSVIFFSL